jgi:hypothetical protein
MSEHSTAHNIRAPGLCRASGRHLSESANEGDLSAADLAELDEFYRRADASEPTASQKAARNDEAALSAQIARLVNGGYLG